MSGKGRNQFYEIQQRTNRPNIYTNNRLNNGIEDIKCFSSPRPLSAEDPYKSLGRSPHAYLRSRQKSSKSPKPMRTGKLHPPNQQNINLYFNKQEYENKLKGSPKPKISHSKSSQKNIYISKNINTEYGIGHFRANYQNVFSDYPYKGEQKSKQKQPKKDFYTKFKTKPVFKPSGGCQKTFINENELYQQKVKNPYKPIDEEHLFRAKTPENKFLNRFNWKPTTQFVKKVQQ